MQFLVAIKSTLSRISHIKAKHFESLFKNLKQVNDGNSSVYQAQQEQHCE